MATISCRTGDGKPAETDGNSETRDGCRRVLGESNAEKKQRLQTETSNHAHTQARKRVVYNVQHQERRREFLSIGQ